jgi:ribonuclease HI
MKLYADATFTWQKYADTDDKLLKGKICIIAEDNPEHPFNVIEEVIVGRVEGLKQYINIYELIAVARAIELAKEKGWDDIQIFTDSFIAKTWANKKVSASPFTEAHRSCQEYIIRAKAEHGGKIEVGHVLRDHNPAGELLEIELEKTKL